MAGLIAALGLAAAVLLPDLLLAQGNDNGGGQSGKPPGQYVQEIIQDLTSGRARGEAASGVARNRNSGQPTHCPVEGSFTNPGSCQCPPQYTSAVRYGESVGVQLLYKSSSPQLNGKVEHSHRSDEQEFYQPPSTRGDVYLKAKLQEWERFYNLARPHGAHNGKTPSEALRAKL